MQFFLSGELEHDIGDFYSRISNRIEKALKASMGKRRYGTGIKGWSYLAMIPGENAPPEWKEVKHYHKRDKDFEFRLIIDHDKFKKADRRGRTVMVCQSLLRSLDLMEQMRVPDVDVARLREDFVALAKQKKWIE